MLEAEAVLELASMILAVLLVSMMFIVQHITSDRNRQREYDLAQTLLQTLATRGVESS